jgi:hypothetical protein
MLDSSRKDERAISMLLVWRLLEKYFTHQNEILDYGEDNDKVVKDTELELRVNRRLPSSENPGEHPNYFVCNTKPHNEP